MNLVTVWRVENTNGNGPYNPPYQNDAQNKLALTLKAAHCGDYERPGPMVDFSPKDMSWVMRTEAVFGFLLKEDAVAWFEGFWDRLEACGYALVTYNVPPENIGAIGTTQIAFRK